MSWGGYSVPVKLQDCPADILEGYVRGRILALAGSASVAKRLNVSADAVRQAFAETLTEAAPLRAIFDSDEEDAGAQLRLNFSHDCLSLGCLEPGCVMCAQNPHRRCSGNFSTKYLSGDVLKAKCGASIRVEVVRSSNFEPVRGSAIEDIYLEMCILDGKAYTALQDAGREGFEEDVEGCIIATNNQGKELLVPGRNATHNEDKWVVVQLARGQAYLPDLSVTGSSEALLSGQKPPFRLLVRAMSLSTHQRASHIRFAVSEAFVVATPRVRTAAKAEIPHLDDHVSKLHAVGNMTQNKLQDINAAAIAVGVYDIHVPYNTVTKVGQFKELVEVAEHDPALCETLKKVLKLTRGWEVARDHAMTAVSTDNQMRIWYSDATSQLDSREGGLLFKCNLGTVDLDAPVGLLQKKQQSGKQTTLEASLVQRLGPAEKEVVRKLQKKAAVCWWQPGHPGWAIWPVDTQQFIQDMIAPVPGLLTTDMITTSPIAPTSNALMPGIDPYLDIEAMPPPSTERPVTRSSQMHSQAQCDQKPLQGENQYTPMSRTSTPSEGAASLDGWVPTQNASVAVSSEYESSRQSSMQSGGVMRFAPPPSPRPTPSWGVNASFPAVPNLDPLLGGGIGGNGGLGGNSGMGGNTMPAPPRHPMASGPTWDPATGYRSSLDAAADRTGSVTSSPYGALGAESQRGANPPHMWSDGFGNGSVETLNPRWRQQQQQAPQNTVPWGALPGYKEEPAGVPGIIGNHFFGSSNNRLPPMGNAAQPSAGVSRKRESREPSTAAQPGGPAQNSNPLPSPFGQADLQNMDLPAAQAALQRRQHDQMMQQRVSSGIERGAAKRQHLSPAELQERLSLIVGRPLGAQEMSRIIPNFPELLEDPSSTDLPSMTLTGSDLAGLMDAMLEQQRPMLNNGNGNAILPPAGQSQRLGGGMPAMPATSVSDIVPLDSYTYADLAEAVDLLHQGGAPPALSTAAGAPLQEPRSSAMLMDYLSSRIGHPEGNGALSTNHRGPSMSLDSSTPVKPEGGAAPEDAKPRELMNSRSGLESLQSMEDALPIAAS